MELITKEGFDFRFNPKACEECGGKCCIGESGYIWVNNDEIDNISKYLNISKNEFIKRYLIKAKGKYSLKEKVFEEGFACIFFDEKNCNCSIYDVRPTQCRTFPFWDYLKTRISEVKQECPGIVDL